MTIHAKTIWINDATTPLGSALALSLASGGNYVIVSGANETALQRLVESGRGAITRLALDTGNPQSVAWASAKLRVMTDCLDIAVITSGPVELSRTIPLDPALMENWMETVFFSVVRSVSMATPLLQRAATPQIVIIRDQDHISGSRPHSYHAGSAALAYYARSVCHEFKSASVTDVITPPGRIRGRQNSGATPLMLSPEQLARTIVTGVAQRRTTIKLPGYGSWLQRLLHYLPITR